jgi:hypothetical protein
MQDYVTRQPRPAGGPTPVSGRRRVVGGQKNGENRGCPTVGFISHEPHGGLPKEAWNTWNTT